MTDLDQLQRRDDEIRAAEYHALHLLAEHLREAIRDLPSESRLGLIFLRHAERFDLWATGGDASLHADVQLLNLEDDLDDMHEDDREGGVRDGRQTLPRDRPLVIAMSANVAGRGVTDDHGRGCAVP